MSEKIIAPVLTDIQVGTIVKWNPFQAYNVKYMNPDKSGNNVATMWYDKAFEGEKQVREIRKGCWAYMGLHYARQQLLVKGVDYE